MAREDEGAGGARVAFHGTGFEDVVGSALDAFGKKRADDAGEEAVELEGDGADDQHVVGNAETRCLGKELLMKGDLRRHVEAIGK